MQAKPDGTAAVYVQPNSNDCFVCGRNNPHGLRMTFYDDGHQTVISDYAVPEAYQGYPGIVHGGVVAAMLDEVVGRVAMIGDHHHFMFSVTLQIKFRQSVPTDTPLRLIGRVVRLRGRLGKAVGEVRLAANDHLLAEAEMTLADVPQEVLDQADLEALGWRVG